MFLQKYFGKKFLKTEKYCKTFMEIFKHFDCIRLNLLENITFILHGS